MTVTLKLRFALVFGAYTLLVLSVFSGAYYWVERRELLRAQRAQQEASVAKTAEVCRLIATTSSAIVAVQYVERLSKDPSVLFAACVDGEGRIQAHSDARLLGRSWRAPEGAFLRSAPEGAAAGAAYIAYDPAALASELRRRLRQTVRVPLAIAGATFVLGLLISLLLAWGLSRPIQALAAGARKIGGGDLDYQSPVARRADELGLLATEMNSMVRRLKQLDELKDEFISHVSHDLRNPMAAITMYADRLLGASNGDHLTQAHQEIVSLIKDNAARLNVFVTNILDAAKIKAGRMEYHLRPVPLAQAAANVEALFAVLAQQKEISLSVKVPAGLPPAAADPERLENILANLVSNALKFTRLGGTVSIEAAAVGSPHDARFIEVAVRDTGRGIPQEALPNLFKRFYQAEPGKESSGRIQGSGLGLFIIKQTVEGMGGSVGVESQAGKGSRFFLRLPVWKAP